MGLGSFGKLRLGVGLGAARGIPGWINRGNIRGYWIYNGLIGFRTAGLAGAEATWPPAAGRVYSIVKELRRGERPISRGAAGAEACPFTGLGSLGTPKGTDQEVCPTYSIQDGKKRLGCLRSVFMEIQAVTEVVG
jgi:hypothetical protein